MWSRHEIGLDRTYLAYFLFSPMIERPQMLPYNRKLHAAAHKITITITIVNLGYIWEELTRGNPLKRECCLLAS